MDSWFVFAWVITSLGYSVCAVFCVESESEEELSEEEVFFFRFFRWLGVFVFSSRVWCRGFGRRYAFVRFSFFQFMYFFLGGGSLNHLFCSFF